MNVALSGEDANANGDALECGVRCEADEDVDVGAVIAVSHSSAADQAEIGCLICLLMSKLQASA